MELSPQVITSESVHGTWDGDGCEDSAGIIMNFYYLVNGLVLVYYSICHWQWNMVAFMGIFLHIFGYLLLLVLSLKYSDIIYVSKDFYINAILLSFGNCPCWLL